MTARALLRTVARGETFAIVAAVAVLAGLSLAHEDVRPAPLDSYSSNDAASGGYRAFAELLAREGVRVERFGRRPAYLDASVDTLVYVEPLPFDPRAAGQQTAADASALDAWVRGGGRLLYVGRDDVAARKGVLGLPRTIARRAADRARPANDYAVDGVRDVRSSEPRRYRPTPRVRDAFDDGRGTLVATYARGRGSVVAVADETLFRNDRLARADRARLGYAIARPRRADGVVAFDEAIHGESVPTHWWEIVPRASLAALALAGIALTVALVGAATRLGPPLVPEPRDDRGGGDFTEAFAGLLARGRAGAHLVRAAERSLASAHDVDAGTHERAGRSYDDGEREAYRALVALAATATISDADVVRGMALAQRLRKDAHDRSRR